MVLVNTRRAEYIVKHTFSISTNGCLPQCAQALKTKLFANRGMICVSGPLVELRQDCQNQTRARVSSTNVVLLLSDASALNILFDIYGWPKKSVSLIFVKVSSIWNIIFVFLYVNLYQLTFSDWKSILVNQFLILFLFLQFPLELISINIVLFSLKRVRFLRLLSALSIQLYSVVLNENESCL